MKTRSLLQPVEYIWTGDPALDKSHPSYSDEKYLAEFNMCHRPAKDGETPAVFRLAPLPRRVMQRLLKLDKSDQLFEAAIHSLSGVSGWEHNGTLVVLGEGHFTEAGGLRRLTDDWVDKHYDALLFMELGGAAIGASGIRPLSV